ncbi:MAG: HAMP domain-containing sensor histidine kinase [Tunicatimonas sp.]
MLRLNSLPLKLSLLFVALLLTVSAIYFYTILGSTGEYVAEVTQQRNRALATSIAQEMKIDSATNRIPEAKLKELFHAAMIINPSIKLYIVGHDGEILTASALPGEVKLDSVNVENIENFLDDRVPLPIYNDDPREPAQPKIFSAAALASSDGSLHCYLYITLNNDGAYGDEGSVRQSYIFKIVGRALLMVLGVVMVIGLLLIFLVTRDLKRIVTAVRRMEQGDYSARVSVRSSDELSELGTAFNTMADEIGAAMQQLKQNDELRRELIANVSHDLRTPLASVEGYVETILLKDHLLSESEKKSYLETILKNTRSLGNLVSELFQLSKLEARQIQANPETFSVSELVHDIVLQFRPHAEANQVTLDYQCVENIPLVYADVSLIERVLQNLISNAMQHTPAGGRVSVAVANVQQRVRLEVVDTGAGISEQDLHHIFNRFYRSRQVRSQSKGGLGLGLAIAQKIVALHQSELHVRSAVGQGTTFWFSLPVTTELVEAKA